MEDDTIIRFKPGCILVTTMRSILRSVRRVFKTIFMSARHLIPAEVEAAGAYIM